MLNDIMLSVIMLNVVAPFLELYCNLIAYPETVYKERGVLY
jgi:hypothetical protein